MPQDRHLDPMTTREVSRPRQTHTWHFTVFGGGRDWRNSTSFWRHKSLSARSVSFGEDISPHWTSSHELSLSMTSHWWSRLNSASQFTQLSFSGARGTGDGISFKQGEKWAGEFSGIGWHLRISFSGDSTSLLFSYPLRQRGDVLGRRARRVRERPIAFTPAGRNFRSLLGVCSA